MDSMKKMSEYSSLRQGPLFSAFGPQIPYVDVHRCTYREATSTLQNEQCLLKELLLERRRVVITPSILPGGGGLAVSLE
jgi:hypothetical protein